MAIYSLNVRSIGRTTHAAGTAGAHIRYIARDDAEPVVMAWHMPGDRKAARAWLDHQEAGDRKNARVVDKVRIALPIELDRDQRAELVRDFVEKVTQGRVPCFAAIHQEGADETNPHLHLVIRDRDIETGRRHVRLSDSAKDWQKAGRPEDHPIMWVRKLWEAEANRALERATIPARIDHRTLEAQGIDRKPTIHVGPCANHIDSKIHRPTSKAVDERSWRRTQYREKTPYPDIDLGRTRREANDNIIDFNIEKDARSPDFATRKWAEFEREQRAKDKLLEADVIAAMRKQHRELKRISERFAAKRAEMLERKRAEIDATRDALDAQKAALAAATAARQDQERESLDRAQKALTRRLVRILDITGRTRKADEAKAEALERAHAAEKERLEAKALAALQAQRSAIAGRYRGERAEIAQDKQAALRAIEDRHADIKEKIQAAQQARERAREAARRLMGDQIDAWKRDAKAFEKAAKSKNADRPGSAADKMRRNAAKRRGSRTRGDRSGPDYER